MNNTWLLIVGLVVAGIAGLASAGLVYLDLSQRRMGSVERLMWLAIALLLPGFGLGVYYLLRFLNVDKARSGEDKESLWVTHWKRPARPGQADARVAGGETIAAVDLLHPPAPAPAALHVQLRVLSGPETGKLLPIGRLPAVIGRGSEAAAPLDGDVTVSRRHAELYTQQGALRIRDLGSSHGTQVNSFSIQDKRLEIGDRIQVGQSLLQVEP